MRRPRGRPAIRSAARYGRRQSQQDFESRFEFGSSLPLFIIVKNLSELRELFLGCLPRRERTDQQILHGPIEAPLEQITRKLLLNQLPRMDGSVHMRSIRLITLKQSFLRHDLHELQHRRVLRGLPLPPQRLIHLADGARASAPENSQNFEFGFCWPYMF